MYGTLFATPANQMWILEIIYRKLYEYSHFTAFSCNIFLSKFCQLESLPVKNLPILLRNQKLAVKNQSPIH